MTKPMMLLYSSMITSMGCDHWSLILLFTVKSITRK